VSDRTENWMGDDRRRAPRIAVDYSLRFAHGEGRVRNISSSGMYFETPARIVSGAVMRAVLEGSQETAGEVTARLRIIRVDDLGEFSGVAAAVEGYSIVGTTPDATVRSTSRTIEFPKKPTRWEAAQWG
jgi:hypothetical protein